MGEQEKEDIQTEETAAQGQGDELVEVPPSAGAPAHLEAEMKKLNECLEEKTKEAKINYDKFLRACADLENYKKRAEKEKGDLINFANERLIKEILPAVDNLERAIDHIRVPEGLPSNRSIGGIKQGEDELDLSAIKDGIKLVLDNMVSVLKKFGIEVVSSLGEKFDPMKHEAVSQEETTEHKPGTVIKEFHKCYYLNNRLIRPAMVVIAKTPEPSTEMEEAAGGEE